MTQKVLGFEEKIKELEAKMKEKDIMIENLKKELHRKEVQCKKLEHPFDKD